MWNAIGKSLLILIATVLTVDPVLACCFPAPQDIEQSVVQTDSPPCHGGATAVSLDAPQEPADQSCPGCGDCSTAMMAADHELFPALLASTTEDDDTQSCNDEPSRVDTYSAWPPPQIPNWYTVRSAETPISLKQRLLI